MPPSMMDHPSDCPDLTITANHGDSLSGTVMIGNDSGLQYLDDGWRLTLGPWERLSQAASAETRCLLTAIGGSGSC